LFVWALAWTPVAGQQASPEWTRHEAKDALFSAEFPQKEITVDEKPNATHYATTLPGTDTDFRVGVTPLEDVPATPEDVLAKLTSVRDETASLHNATLTNKQEIEDDGYKGIQFDMQLNVDGQELTLTCRYFIANRRFYQVLVGHLNSHDISAEKRRFLESFTILEPEN